MNAIAPGARVTGATQLTPTPPAPPAVPAALAEGPAGRTTRRGTLRTALIGATGLMGVGWLAACGGQPAPAGTGGPVTAAQKALSGTLTIWWPNASFDPATVSVVADVQKRFQQQNPNVTIDAVVQGSADKLTTGVAAGTPADFF